LLGELPQPSRQEESPFGIELLREKADISRSRRAAGLTTAVTWALTPTPSGTLVRMQQAGFRVENENFYRGAGHGWPKMLRPRNKSPRVAVEPPLLAAMVSLLATEYDGSLLFESTMINFAPARSVTIDGRRVLVFILDQVADGRPATPLPPRRRWFCTRLAGRRADGYAWRLNHAQPPPSLLLSAATDGLPGRGLAPCA
jgi:hypothetical protein